MKFVHRMTAFVLSLLGLSVYVRDSWAKPKNTKIVEGFKLEDYFLSVYGGRNNYITTKLYGKILDKEKNMPLADVKVALYSGTSEMAVTYTQEDGSFYFDSESVWAGVGVDYTIIVSAPNKEYKPVRQDISFETYEVTREEILVLEKNE